MRVTKTGDLRILDFDIENMPLTYWIDDRPTALVTAIAWSWVGAREVECRLLTHDPDSTMDMLTAFEEAYQDADIVTGHYIRRHDLPILTGAFVENGLLPLEPKLAQDTKLDLINWKDLPQSQEYLASMYGLSRPKHHMSQHEWREANKLTPEGLELTRKRVVSDVKQNKQLRQFLIDQGVLAAPTLWSP